MSESKIKLFTFFAFTEFLNDSSVFLNNYISPEKRMLAFSHKLSDCCGAYVFKAQERK